MDDAAAGAAATSISTTPNRAARSFTRTPCVLERDAPLTEQSRGQSVIDFSTLECAYSERNKGLAQFCTSASARRSCAIRWITVCRRADFVLPAGCAILRPVRDFAALWILAFVASIAIGSHGILYWDAGDYVTQALTGQLSGLLLGRPLFLWISRAVLAAGVDPVHAEPVLRWFWCAFGSLAAPGLMMLARALGLARGAAFTAGAALALSPSFAHTSHQVLTDSPALAFSIAALAVVAAGLA